MTTLAWIAIIGPIMLLGFLFSLWTEDGDWKTAAITMLCWAGIIGLLLLSLYSITWGINFLDADHKASAPVHTESP
jgi:hypothetical protein